MRMFSKLIRISFLFVFYCAICGFSNPQLKLLERLVVQERNDQAIKAADELLTKSHDKETTVEIKYFLGVAKLKLGAYKEAQNIFRDLRNQTKDELFSDQIDLGLIDAYYLNGEYKSALRVGKDFLDRRPQTNYKSLLYFKLARINLKLANWIDARDLLKKIVRQYPKSLEVEFAKQLLTEKQYFAVQVGAYLDRYKAEQQASELKSHGEYAYVVEMASPKGQIFYRVRVGQLAYLDQAEELRQKLAKQGYPGKIYP